MRCIRNNLFILFICLICLSCQKEKDKIDISKINGYWEIMQAQNPYGKNIIYNLNTQIDYHETKDSIGFTKKLQPDIYGNFLKTNALEKFKIMVENDTLKLLYSNAYDKWAVYVLRLSDSLMLIKNEKDFLYTYKRYKPILINP